MPPTNLEPYDYCQSYQDQDAHFADPQLYSSDLQSFDLELRIGAGAISGFYFPSEPNPPNSYLTNTAPLVPAAEDTFSRSTDDTFETSPSTLPWNPHGYPNTSTDAHLGYRPFSGLPVSQNAFDPYSGQFEVDETSLSYQEENHSRLIWNVNAQSSSSTDRWTAPLLNRDPYSNYASIPVCQSGDDSNVYPNLGICRMADNHDFSGSCLAPFLDNSVADINFIPQFVGYEASSGTTSDTWLGSHPTLVISEEMLSPNTLSTMGPDLLPVANNYLTQIQAGSPDETFNSEMSPSNPDEHGLVQSARPNTCMECQESCISVEHLIKHGWIEAHAPFMCKCGKNYTRDDVLRRHVKAYQPELQKYACPHCKSGPGRKSFKRMDHLTQHIRGYHHIGNRESRMSRFNNIYLCPHSDCLQYREPSFLDLPHKTRQEEKPFGHLKEFTQHMRTEHDDAPYPCDKSGCSRVRGKGYISRTALIKHRKREHPELLKYQDLHSCRLPGCSFRGELYWGIRGHYVTAHGYSDDFAKSLVDWWWIQDPSFLF